jgi:hypothetical protein
MTVHRWLMASIFFIALEMAPPATHFFFLCLAFGALGGAIATVYVSARWLPWAVFVATSVALFPLLIPLAKFIFAKDHPIHAKK